MSKLCSIVDIEDVADEEFYVDVLGSVDDDIVENAEDTPTLLDTYIEQTDTTLDKHRLKTLIKSLYTEAFDYE